ncbi:DNA recombination protein RmuC [Zhihengliuella halotolerans]|uniref:DNA recombination protein RmuC n=1 Tax=Zhihengliuella halotolerans TaxID=370736 RepID=UPI000C802849|nr:DNA recombination protein RmuC [Zhihengliuella halotolerans]
MTALSFVVALLAFVIGAAGGAGALWWYAVRGRTQADTSAYDDVASRLRAAETTLAATRAERDALQDRIVDERQRAAEDRTVLQMMAPLADQLRQVRHQVTTLERDRVEQFGQLSQQLAAAAEQDAALLRTTSSLAGALRNSATRGTWGETQLRRVVEAAGMINRVDFSEQVTSGSAQAPRLRPDMVVHLPAGKSIAVDSKVPLASYLEAQSLEGTDAAGDREQVQARQRDLLRAHAKALRSHVDALAKKEYWEGLPGSPELVVCFLPAESFLAAALEADPGLLDDAFDKNVALASPSTLLSILKGLAYAWRQELLTENARALFDESRELYKRLGTLGGHINDLGKSLKTSVERYNSFIGTLESRVLPSTRRIQDLDPGLTPSAGAEAPTSVEATPRVLSAAELITAEQS